MGRFDELKALIDENITTNGQQEITGAVLNSTLDSIVDATENKLTELESISARVIRRSSLPAYARVQIEGYIPAGATIYNRGIAILLANDNSLGGRIDLSADAYVTVTEDKQFLQTLTESGDVDLLVFFKPEDMVTPSDLYYVPRRVTASGIAAYSTLLPIVGKLPKGGFVYNYGIPVVIANDSSLAGRVDLATGEGAELDSDKSYVGTSSQAGDVDIVVTYKTADNVTEEEISTLQTSIESLDEEVNEVRENVKTLQDVFDSVTEEYSYDEVVQPTVIWSAGFMETNGKIYGYENYCYSNNIIVKEGDVVVCKREFTDDVNSMRVLTAFAGETAVSASGLSSGGTQYVVPAGVDSIVITIDNGILSSYGNRLFISRHNDELLARGVLELRNKVRCLYDRNDKWVGVSDLIIAGNELILAERLDNKKGCQYNVSFKFAGEWPEDASVIVGCGTTGYMSSRLMLSKDAIHTLVSGSDTYQSFVHGLTLSEFVNINIEIPSDTTNGSAIFRINTIGGEFVVGASNDTYFPNCNGKIYLRPSAIDITDVEFAYAVSDLQKNAIIFGDSYISLADSNRWPYYMIKAGHSNYALCGFGGAATEQVIVDFREIITRQIPRFIVWAIGMNDADEESAINASWLQGVEEVRAWCEENDRTLILCTIPNVPDISHIYKNEYVRASGLRYIDFAKAVNAEQQDSTWYSGMLSSDNIHPTAAGAKTLYYRILLDFPEIVA